jgi:GNAT superfamily N-acetyltransferase
MISKRYLDNYIARRVRACFCRDSRRRRTDGWFGNLIQKIKQKLNPKLNPEDVYLSEITRSRDEHYANSPAYTEIIYAIKIKNKTIGIVYVWLFDNGVKYVASLDIEARYRSQGIGTALLKKNFSKHYIAAGNTRVPSLYNRLGRPLEKFSNQENKEFLKAMSGHGVWRLN